MMKIKQILILAFIVLSVVTLGACNNKDADINYPVKQYYASAVYIEDGMDEINGELMPPIDTTVIAKQGEQYLAALNSLKTVPEAEEGCSSVLTDIVVNRVTVDSDGVATVDVDSEGLGDGSLMEDLLIRQVLNTLINSFEEIKSVQFTLDGQVVESLMGHYVTAEPLTLQDIE